MLLHVFILLVSLAFLVISADKFVFGASSLARNFGISPMIIGLTIVAMGTSAPEMMVAAMAALHGNPNTAIGNAIGSNITNITLILGITALLKPLAVSSSMIKKEIPLILVLSVLTYWMFIDHQFTRTEGIILMLGFVIFIVTLLVNTLQQRKDKSLHDKLLEEAEHELPPSTNTKNALLWLLFGMILLPLSANYLVDAAVNIAQAFGISDLVIGLTIIAIGTSLPELAASIASIIKKEDDLAIGNIIGSNVFNLLAVLALPGIIAPGAIDAAAAERDMPIMLGVTLLLFVICFSRRLGYFRITRLKGLLLLSCFLGYQYLLFNI
jgi:cation:H+ antiporter